ncbi:helix-turn-helix domain-containing protein [Pseudooceanicola aestuarii]|uniref:helix-turn-helix domain-containing protein n=1 Tax=Pseudooceanicola aestuarii TaxID=2697319 RepID=UPI0013D4C13C|nr:helix-turn-helix domain-containing protein [Pseudooceanicola aestuarii]
MHPPAPSFPLSELFRIEIVAARLEGALRADAALAALWRGQAAVQEACASAWLEDLPVTPADLLGRPFRDTMGDPDRDRAALAAAALLRGLHSPGALEGNTDIVLSRLWRLSVGEGAAPFDATDHAAIRVALQQADSPVQGALRVAHILNRATDGRAPSVERLGFVAADHALRGSGRFMQGAADPPDLIAAPRGMWVMQPALALVDNGFRLWSVTRPDTVAELIRGLAGTLDRGLGALPMLRRWLDRARAVGQGAHGASRLPDLAALLTTRPIVTGAVVAERLQITPRGAQKLIDQATERALLTKITPRRTYRAWAIPPFARMLGRG